MSEPFLAEIHIVGFNFAPRGYAFCDGQILPINQNQSLYSLLGTTYGGDGRTSFALPDMRGRTPIHRSNSHRLGQKAGEESHVLTGDEIPQHNHTVEATGNQATSNVPEGNLLASKARRTQSYYTTPPSSGNMHGGTIGNTGGSRAHNKMQPFLAINYVIALRGLFPSRN